MSTPLFRWVSSNVRELRPSHSDWSGVTRSWRRDVLAGVTVGVVALPLALGFGAASGAGPAAGIVTAIIAGVVASVAGGSSVQVTGPTGAMAVVLLPMVHRFGLSAIPIIAVMAGILLVIASVAGAGRALTYFPWPVIEGFTVGIALVITFQQLPHLFGVAHGHSAAPLGIAWDAVRQFWATPSLAAPLIALATIGVIALVHRVRPSWPASLLAVAVVTVSTISVHHVARIGSLPAKVISPRLPTGWSNAASLFSAAFAVAILAGLESLLSAKVADGIADHRAHNPTRELFGQGVANIAVAFFGGVPATGAIARTAVNVRSGARTRLAAAVHSLVLLAVLLLAAPWVAKIPLAVLAGVLIATAAGMVERHSVRSVVRSTLGDAAVLVVTAALTVLVDLITAVEIGLVLAAFVSLAAISRNSQIERDDLELDTDESRDAELLRHRIVVYRLEGSLFFGAAQRFFSVVADPRSVEVVIFRMPRLRFLDATGARAFGELVDELTERGIAVLIKGASTEHERILRSTGVIDKLHGEHLFTSMEDAIAHASTHVRRAA